MKKNPSASGPALPDNQDVNYLRSLLNAIREDILVIDRNYRITDVNDHFLTSMGYSQTEVLGRHCYEVCHSEGQPCHELNDGCKLFEVFSTGGARRCQHIHSRADGSEVWVDISLSPLQDPAGNVTHAIHAARDVTEIVHAEKQLRQAQKLEALGILAGGIAHDFNNILAAIIGYTELTLMKADDPEAVRRNLGEVRKAGHRAKDLVGHILAFSRRSEGERKPILIGPIVKEALKLLKASLPSTIEIRQSIERDSGTVVADPIQIYQVLMNLCTNAADAIGAGGGTLSVELCRLDPGEHNLSLPGDLPPGPYLRLTVQDTGEGMTPETMDRLFDTSFTTKEEPGGTGLGLPVVRQIVESHGGRVVAESKVGAGSTFHMFLPLILRAEGKRRDTEDLPKGGEHILFVDDETDLLELGKQLLGSLGYTVTVAGSGVRALSLFREDPDAYDMVITDMTMPRVTGDNLAREIIAQRPDIPVILCTGFSDRITKTEAEQLGIKAFLMKPLKIKDLATIVRTVLDSG
jgi:PAS domain S-box-containing protein